MSATLHRLTVGMTMADPERWSPAELAACEASGAGDYDGWFAALVRAAIEPALDAFAAEHPTLVASPPMVV